MKIATTILPRVSAALAVAATLGGCAAPETHSATEVLGNSQGELLEAPLDQVHTFSVGVCAGPLKEGATPGSRVCAEAKCSGTLVAPNLVLTAQHCIYGLEYADAWCDATFTNERLTKAPVRVTTSQSTIVGSPKWYGVDEILVPAKNLCHDDVALLVLKRSVPQSEAEPVAMALGRNVAQNPPNKVAIVGRGAVSESLDFDTWEMSVDEAGLKRRVLEHIPFVCASDVAGGCTVADATSPGGVFSVPSSYFVVGASIAGGDSGSGVFGQGSFGESPRLLGVSAAATYDGDGKPNFGLVSRLDAHREFLRAGLRAAARARGVRSEAVDAAD